MPIILAHPPLLIISLPLLSLILIRDAALYEARIEWTLFKDVFVAHHEELFAGACDGYVEFAVNDTTSHLLFHRENTELIGL